jgi:hypothetical protein
LLGRYERRRQVPAKRLPIRANSPQGDPSHWRERD